LPSPDTIGAFLTAPVVPLDAVLQIVVALAWALWLWVMASFALEVALVLAESAARGAVWVRGLRTIVDRLSMPLARRAVAAAFALQLVSRAVPAVAAPLPETEQTLTIGASTPDSATTEAWGPSSAYRVRAGDTLWSIAQEAYGSGAEYRRLVDANVGRRMADGEQFAATGVIKPGWVLDVPEPTAWVHSEDGVRWYTVRQGDTLSTIAARVLGDTERWPELFELNRAVATLDNGRALAEPNLIWPGLRLRLPGDREPTAEALVEEPRPEVLIVERETPDETPDERPDEAPDETPDETTLQAAAAPIDATPVDVMHASDTVEPPPPLVRDLHPLPPIELEPAPIPDELPPANASDPAPFEVPVPAVAAFGLAATVGAAAVGMRRLRRLRPLPQEPESEIVVQGGYAEAQITPEFARRTPGGHDFDSATALLRQLVPLLSGLNVSGVQPIALRHGRSSTTVSLAASLSEQPLILDAVSTIGSRLHAEAEAWVSSDGDVQLHITGVRKSRLLPVDSSAQEAAVPDFVPFGVLYDHRVFSAAWPAVGHVLVVSLPGRGADMILTSLLATLTARRSPHELRVWLAARPRALPSPIDDLPHLDTVIDPDDAEELEGLIARLRAELDQRALGGAWPELLIVVPELTSLGDRAADLQLLASTAASSGVRLIAASAEPTAAAQCLLLPCFTTRMVLQMEAEETSVALLGTADAAYLGGGGRLQLRHDGREPVEMYGYQVAPENLERLVKSMRSAYLAGPPTPVHEPLDDDDETELSGKPPETPPDVKADEPVLASVPPHEPDEDEDRVPMVTAAPIQVYCFGAPRVLCMGELVWPKPFVGEAKPWELLLYLACQPAAGVAREQMFQALWPDDPVEADHTHRVRNLRYRLRLAFGQVEGAPSIDGIHSERNVGPFFDPAIVRSDAQEFAELTRRARVFPGPENIPGLERARALYTGDLLTGPDTRRYAWIDERDESGITMREYFRRQFLQATLTLAELYTDVEQVDHAIELYRELLTIDPADESIWRALFQLHASRSDAPALMRE
jgi:DNA-binding SARP family transcriptional activator/LysM repeat protein